MSGEQTATGWRFWVVPTLLLGTADVMLYSPYATPPKPWPERRYVATCPGVLRSDEHTPPGDACVCGVHAVVNLVDLLFHARSAMTRRECRSTAGLPVRTAISSGAHGDYMVVVGRVTTYRPLEVIAPSVSMAVEVKGEAAQIEALYVCPTEADHEDAESLQGALAARYQVPVVVGEPAYDAQDWLSRSQEPSFYYKRVGLRRPRGARGAQPLDLLSVNAGQPHPTTE